MQVSMAVAAAAAERAVEPREYQGFPVHDEIGILRTNIAAYAHRLGGLGPSMMGTNNLTALTTPPLSRPR